LIGWKAQTKRFNSKTEREQLTMASALEDMIDRRALRRKLSFWRIIAIAVAALAIAAIGAMGMNRFGGTTSDHIARIAIDGAILNDRDLIARIAEAAENEQVKAIIIAVDSPGGTTVGGEATREAVIKAKAKKPVVAEVSTMAASAGYMIAAATDHIVARESSIVGSIGVLVQVPNFSGLMQRIGISVDTVKSAPLKAEPSALNPTTPEELAMLDRMVRDSYNWFVDLVVADRKMTRAEVLALADGSIFTGRQAKERKLVDALGGEDAVRAFFKTKNIEDDLDIIDWDEPAREPFGLFGLAAGLFGLSTDVAGDFARATGTEALFLDGLVSLWQVQGTGETSSPVPSRP
jgi:protease IV